MLLPPLLNAIYQNLEGAGPEAGLLRQELEVVGDALEKGGFEKQLQQAQLAVKLASRNLSKQLRASTLSNDLDPASAKEESINDAARVLLVASTGPVSKGKCNACGRTLK